MSRRTPVRIVVAAAVGAIVCATGVARAQTTAQPVEWTNVVNAAPSGSAIHKNGGCAGCPDAGATSTQAMASGDG